MGQWAPFRCYVQTASSVSCELSEISYGNLCRGFSSDCGLLLSPPSPGVTFPPFVLDFGSRAP